MDFLEVLRWGVIVWMAGFGLLYGLVGLAALIDRDRAAVAPLLFAILHFFVVWLLVAHPEMGVWG